MDTSKMNPEEYAIYLVNTINAGSGAGIDNSVLLAAAEVDRLLSVLGPIKGMSKISKMSYFKKVRKYLADM